MKILEGLTNISECLFEALFNVLTPLTQFSSLSRVTTSFSPAVFKGVVPGRLTKAVLRGVVAGRVKGASSQAVLKGRRTRPC